MTPARKRRLYMVLGILAGTGLAAALIFQALQENMNLYYEPVRVKAGEAPKDHDFRLGGMVVDNSIERDEGSLTVRFDLTDYQEVVTVHYTGILPDLFREGQGIITRGRLNAEGEFVAEEVLAKHDENYMPPEVAASLEAAKTAQQEAKP